MQDKNNHYDTWVAIRRADLRVYTVGTAIAALLMPAIALLGNARPLLVLALIGSVFYIHRLVFAEVLPIDGSHTQPPNTGCAA